MYLLNSLKKLCIRLLQNLRTNQKQNQSHEPKIQTRQARRHFQSLSFSHPSYGYFSRSLMASNNIRGRNRFLYKPVGISGDLFNRVDTIFGLLVLH